MGWRRSVVGAVVVWGLIVSAGAMANPSPNIETHCVILVEGQRPSGELIVSRPTCYESLQTDLSTIDLCLGAPHIRLSDRFAAKRMTAQPH